MRLIRHSINWWARELSCDRKTITKGLSREGIDGRSGRYSAREVFAAIAGDAQRERTLKVRAERQLAELKRNREEGDLIPKVEVAKFIRESFVPVREQVVAMPGTMAAKVNPSDPQHAKAHLEAWRDMFLRVCKEVKP